MQKNNLAAIDLGTNSCRLYIADKHGNKLYRDGQPVMLGSNMSKTMSFTPEAMQRTINCLMVYRDLMESYDVNNYRAITTASCRMAQNSAEFIAMVKEKCNIDLQIVTPQEEALLNLRGASLNADKQKPYILVYDLGGGSTEITLATNSEHPKILKTVSIPLGARNSAEIYDITEYDSFKAAKLQAEIKKYTQEFIQTSNFAEYLPQCSCLATSSTALRLAAMINKAKVYDNESADGTIMNTADIDAQINNLHKMNLSGLCENKYIGSKRAPIFIAASIIFQTIYKELQLTQLTASLKGAMEAIIGDLRQNGKINSICKESSRSQNADR